jgi:hypothetical protein
MKLGEKLLFIITDLFLKNVKDISLEGPYFFQGSNHHEILKEMQIFRKKQNLQRAPYLEESFQLEIEKELSLDERSAHFIARKNQEIVISLRLTPGPFELSALSDELVSINEQYSGYWEFSRLCTDIHLPVKGKVAKYLLIKAGLWLFSQTKAKGIVAICQTGKIKFMSKFALYPEKVQIELKNRIGTYAFLTAPRQLILFRFMKEFLSFSSVKIRTKKITPKTQLAT